MVGGVGTTPVRPTYHVKWSILLRVTMPNSTTTKILASIIMIIIVATIIIIIGDSLLIIRHNLLNFYGSILVNEEDFI